MFRGLPLRNGDMCRSQTQFAHFYEGWGFFGTLTVLTVDAMFDVRVSAPSTLRVQGTAAVLPRPIHLNGPGWTFLPCPYQRSVALEEGVPTGVSFSLGDQVMDRLLFSVYYPSQGWFGSLKTFKPGTGYKLKVNAKGGLATFQSRDA
jgi:hypothetical protein